MKAIVLGGWRPILTAFVIWFVHFMLCWAAVEIWPGQPRANRLAWLFTGMALLAMGGHFMRVRASTPADELTGWTRRFACGAIAIATAAIVFSAVPSIVFVGAEAVDDTKSRAGSGRTRTRVDPQRL